MAEEAWLAAMSQIISGCYKVIKQLLWAAAWVGPVKLGISGGEKWLPYMLGIF